MSIVKQEFVELQDLHGNKVTGKEVTYNCDWCHYEFSRRIRKGAMIMCPKCKNFLKSGWKT